MAKKKPAAKAKVNPAQKVAATQKPKVKPPSKAQKSDWISEKANELDRQEKIFARSVCEWDSAHAEAAQAKKEMELQQQRLNAIVQDIVAIKRGNFTPPLPFKGSIPTGGAPQPVAPPAEDVGGKKPLRTLIAKNLKATCAAKYRDGIGLSEKQIDKLEEIIGGNTIGQLEKFQRENSFDWNRKMKGFGETGVDKLQDAMSVFRSAFPIPSPDDKIKPLTPSQSSANAAASNSKPVDPLTKAFTDGQEACRTGKELKHCPHPSATPLELKWIEGFEAEKSAKSTGEGSAEVE